MDKYENAKQMIDYIIKENILTYSEFYEYAKQNNEEWYETLRNRNIARMIGAYIASRRNQ